MSNAEVEIRSASAAEFVGLEPGRAAEVYAPLAIHGEAHEHHGETCTIDGKIGEFGGELLVRLHGRSGEARTRNKFAVLPKWAVLPHHEAKHGS